MAVQTKANQDTRVTEAGEFLAAESANIKKDKPIDGADDNLLHLLERSAQNLRHASENVENRGLKLLLKVLAQERSAMNNALRQYFGQHADDALDPDNKNTGTSLQEGLQDIQTSMTVQRQGRENVALSHVLEDEERLLAAYDAKLHEGERAPYSNVLTSQRAHVAEFLARLQAVGAGIEPIVARVFDTRSEGEHAASLLRERGLEKSQIDVAPITQVALPVAQTAAVAASPKSAIVAGAFSGVVIGGILGLVIASFVWFAPQLIGWVTFSPWLLLLSAILIGLVLGTVFGFFIGQNKREDDLAVTADGLFNGEILVVAYPHTEQIAMAEEVLQVHHARELNR